MKVALLNIYFFSLLLLPLALILLPANFFDQGETICLSVQLFDQECPGCGMTRGIQHLVHFDLRKALEYNKLSLVVLPLLIFLWIKELLRIRKVLKGVNH